MKTRSILIAFWTGLLLVALAATGGQGAMTPPPPAPGSEMSVTPSPVDFGSVDVGASGSQVFTVTNLGTIAGTVSGIALAGIYAGEYAVLSDFCTGVLMQPMDVCTFQVDFTPAGYGARPVTINVSSDDPLTPVFAVSASAMALAADVVVRDGVTPATDRSMAFGSLNPGLLLTRAVRVYNVGNKAMDVGDMTSGGALPAAPFGVVSDGCSLAQVAPGGNCLVELRYAPGANGNHATSISVPTNDPETPLLSVALSGSAILGGGLNTAPPTALLTSPAPAGSALQPFNFEWTESHDVDADVVNYKIFVSLDPYFVDSMAVEAQVNSIDSVASAAGAVGTVAVLMSLCGSGGGMPRRRLTGVLVAGLMLAVLLASSCGGPGPSGENPLSTHVTMTLGASATSTIPTTVSTVVMRISGEGMGEVERIMDITDHNTAVSQVFDVPNGTDRLFEVFAFDKGNHTRYYGKRNQALLGDPVVMDMALEIVLLKYTYPGSGLTPGAVYYWKVQADDGRGGVKESAVQSFTAL